MVTGTISKQKFAENGRYEKKTYFFASMQIRCTVFWNGWCPYSVCFFYFSTKPFCV